MSIFKENLASVKIEDLPSWVSLDKDKMSGKVLSLPKSDEVEKLFDLTAIVEFYSR